MAEPWPDAEVGSDLLRRLRDGDPVAPSDFAAAYLDPLIAFLRATQRGVHEHALVTAAEDAVLSILRCPTVYVPSRSDLPTYLRMSALGDLRNLLERESRHHRQREDRDCVELPAEGGNDFPEDELPSFDHPALAEVVAALAPVERQVFELMRSGERKTEAFAEVLGLDDRPTDVQAREVKRAKDRIKVRLKRAVEGP
jgi:DNA-directed RNA polymerase specialized sigma24 family protein